MCEYRNCMRTHPLSKGNEQGPDLLKSADKENHVLKYTMNAATLAHHNTLTTGVALIMIFIDDQRHSYLDRCQRMLLQQAGTKHTWDVIVNEVAYVTNQFLELASFH